MPQSKFGGKIVLAKDLFDDGERIDSIAEKAWIAQEYFFQVNRGKSGKQVVSRPVDLEVRRFRTKDGHKPDASKVFETGYKDLVLDRDIYWGRRRYLAGYDADPKLLGFIEVVGVEG
jgi:hypothetical protein